MTKTTVKRGKRVQLNFTPYNSQDEIPEMCGYLIGSIGVQAGWRGNWDLTYNPLGLLLGTRFAVRGLSNAVKVARLLDSFWGERVEGWGTATINTKQMIGIDALNFIRENGLDIV